jgi:hypothetical protein
MQDTSLHGSFEGTNVPPWFLSHANMTLHHCDAELGSEAGLISRLSVKSNIDCSWAMYSLPDLLLFPGLLDHIILLLLQKNNARLLHD